MDLAVQTTDVMIIVATVVVVVMVMVVVVESFKGFRFSFKHYSFKGLWLKGWWEVQTSCCGANRMLG